jgi:hypothetical protein
MINGKYGEVWASLEQYDHSGSIQNFCWQQPFEKIGKFSNMELMSKPT